MKREIFRNSYLCKHTVTETTNSGLCNRGTYIQRDDRTALIYDFFDPFTSSKNLKWRFHLVLTEEDEEVDKKYGDDLKTTGIYRVKTRSSSNSHAFLFYISIKSGLSDPNDIFQLGYRTTAIAWEYLACFNIYCDILEDLKECGDYSRLDLRSNKDPSVKDVHRLLASVKSMRDRIEDTERATGESINSVSLFKKAKEQGTKAFQEYMRVWRYDSRVEAQIVTTRTVQYLQTKDLGHLPEYLI